MRKSLFVMLMLGLLILSSCVRLPTPRDSNLTTPNKGGKTTAVDKSPTSIQQGFQGSGVDCQIVVDEITGLTQDLKVPEHLHGGNPEVSREDFDVNAYFKVLTHLSLEEGFVLDYVYWHDPMGSRPVVYARKEGAPPHMSYEELDNAVEDPLGAYLGHIQVDDTQQGYFEWVVLRTYGEQFYLQGHAAAALDWTIVCNRNAAKEVIVAAGEFGNPFTDEQEQAALQLEFEPRVEMGEETAKVRVVVFSKWGGFYEHVDVISRQFPHQLLESKNEELVPYHSGVMP